LKIFEKVYKTGIFKPSSLFQRADKKEAKIPPKLVSEEVPVP
jgi:hypothetical protein